MPSQTIDPTGRLSAILGPHHIRYLQRISLSHPSHFPTVESRQRFAVAHDLLPVAVHGWYRAKRQAMQKAGQRISSEEFELELPEPRLQPTLEELEEMRRPRVKPQPRQREKAEVKKPTRFSTAPVDTSSSRAARAAARRLRGQSLDSEMLSSDADAASSTCSPLSSPTSEYSTLSLDHIYSGRSDYSATEYDGASECDADDDISMALDVSSMKIDKADGAGCCEGCEYMLSSGLVSDPIPDTPSNIWDTPYSFTFWASFEARAHAPSRLQSMRNAYEESGLASWEDTGRVYADFVWNMDPDADEEADADTEDGARDVAVKEEQRDDEEMVVEGLLFSNDQVDVLRVSDA